MSTPIEERLRAALHATAQEHEVAPGAWSRNAARMRARRRRTAVAGIAAAAVLVAAVTVGALVLRSGTDTVQYAGPGGDRQGCSGDDCPPAPGRFTGPVLDTLVVEGQRFDVLSRDGDRYPVYTICTATTPRSCGQMPALDRYTSVAVPTGDGGAVLFLGGEGGFETQPGDRLVASVDGSDVAVEPPVTRLRSALFPYDLAAVRVPAFAPVHCVAVLRQGRSSAVSTVEMSGIVNAAGNCADAPTG